MRTRTYLMQAAFLCVLLIPAPVLAHTGEDGECDCPKTTASAAGHAPIGVSGDHMHKKGEWMLSYRFMRMGMSGNRDGTNSLSADEIATTVPNRFFGTAGQPATLRVIPKSMTMDMHMVGAMYAPTDWLTLMAMGSYLDKDMEATTYAGMSGTSVLGDFKMNSKGWSDTKIMSEWRLYDDADHNHIHINMGVSLPTGSIKKTDTMLAPNGMTPTMRLGYGMQLGTGTYDLLPGITYTGHRGKWGWGAQYSAQLPLESENDEGYRWDDKHMVTAWGSYEWAQWISTSARLSGTQQGKIHGMDSNIMGPNQAADPDNYGGREVDFAIGVNLIGTHGLLTDHRLGMEVSAPVYRDLNGPQLEKDWRFTIGWQKAF